MIDPMNSLTGLQQALDEKIVKLQSCRLFSDMRMLVDQPNGVYRFTYALLDGKRVRAIAMFAHADPYEGAHCFQIGYAVSEPDRGQGLGIKVAKQGLAELKNGLKANQFKTFYVEAVVGIDNTASNKIAASLFSAAPAPVKDRLSGEDALQYMEKIDLAAN
jgi:hypothetical protein